jgi:hypothetical protein
MKIIKLNSILISAAFLSIGSISTAHATGTLNVGDHNVDSSAVPICFTSKSSYKNPYPTPEDVITEAQACRAQGSVTSC